MEHKYNAESDEQNTEHSPSPEDRVLPALSGETTGKIGPLSAQSRLALMAIIMVGVCVVVMTVMTTILYRHQLSGHRNMLRATAQSQARLIESIARNESKEAEDMNQKTGLTRDIFATTLSQIADAHESFVGFQETGEFTLARREGDSIVFILQHRHDSVQRPEPVDFTSKLAEPMRRALNGMSGTVTGLDYRGQLVIAAYEPVAVLDLGIVAKIDLAEVRAPFIRAGLIAAGLGVIAILVGIAMLARISNPIIARLKAYSLQLEGEVEQRRQKEAELKTVNTFLDTVVDMSPFPMWVSDTDGTIIRVNRSLEEALHSPGNAIIGKYNVLHDKNLETEGLLPLVRDVFDNYKPACFNMPWRGVNSGEAALTGAGDMYIAVSMFPIVDLVGKLMNVVCQWVDISEQKAAETELKAHREHLEELVEDRTEELRKTVRLMTGREKRMAELKEEISRLHEVIAQSGMNNL